MLFCSFYDFYFLLCFLWYRLADSSSKSKEITSFPKTANFFRFMNYIVSGKHCNS